MSKLTLLLNLTLFLSLLLAAAVEVDADVVTPTIATAASSFAIPPEAMIDGSGLDGVGAVEDQLHDTDEENMWISADQTIADQELVFTLDLNYDLTDAYVWNYNGVDDFFGTDNSSRGVDEFEILVSSDLTSSFVSVGTFNLTQADALFPPDEPAQTLSLTGALDVRRIKFNILSAHSGATSGFVGLSEVRFDGTQLPVGPDKTWVADGLGDWFDGANWDPAFAPDGTDQTATFGDAITAPRTVVVDQSATVKAITFANTNRYAIAGTGSVQLEADTGNASISVTGDAVAGAHQFQAVVNLQVDTDANIGAGASLEFVNRLNLNGHTMTKTGLGTLTVSNTLNTGGGTIDCQAGTCNGAGTIGGSLTNSGGSVAPGSSVGILRVAGDFTQSADGTLAIEVDGAVPGSGHDQLAVDQTASLDGALDVDPLAGYADPQNRGDHDDLVVLVANSVEGNFANVDYDGTSLAVGSNYIGTNQNGDDGLFRVLEYASTQVTVTNYLALGGDANGDLTVDGADFLIWNQNKFTAGQNWTAGDFNGDGMVDGADFLIWNTNKFTSADVVSAVPEPSSLLMILIGLIGFGLQRRR